ncbi:protein-L-isoaspartate(D-aspartate) O-methyltransferase [Hydrogenophaga intermedia]|uniref:protein-L-isoaspartate(D-aspartate) O-methyltransferase n=1 Tax=Hydrogenophaga intermedia TaxID=65786 RepID=UPI002042C1E0|nr:protein-L-isoaspartate(D-aspartate) O-methyltransferase [Hydrogenophaga intermedia]MCM3563882.1 protein-L-isoaspartate(D-aspartate) O-methyltransferase [Hydrogenophaga intermedia]
MKQPAPRQRPAFPARLPAGTPAPAPARAPRPVGAAPAPAVPTGVGMESSAVRAAMVRKLQAQGISHPAVVAAMLAVERHRFVDSALVNQAYEDTSLPIGQGQTISKPGVVARMVELLCQSSAQPLGRVLEIGTGCGYQAAVLSRVAREVYSIERIRALHDKARDNLRALRVPNLHLILGDGMAGFAQGAPYAAIIAAAGGNDLPAAWIDQLAVGGRLVAPAVTAAGGQHLVVIDKTARGIVRTELEAVHFVPLKSGLA